MTWILKVVVIAVVVLVVAIFGARILWPLPSQQGRPTGKLIAASSETALGQMMLDGLKQHPGKTGVIALSSGHEALASRLLLIAKAERSIDAQYYIWHDDVSGRLLLRALYQAANRGVRVRLLLDDNGISGLDATLAALDNLPNFEVSLFNPSRIRSPKMLGFVLDPIRMNRRMHNKSLIVDSAAAIIGGRNIGDEYFKIGEKTHFLDLDVLATGAIVANTAQNFDLYWNSRSVHRLRPLIGDVQSRLPDYLDGDLTSAAAPWLKDVPAADFSRAAEGLAGKIEFEWTDVRLFSDDPAKGQGEAGGKDLLINQLVEGIGDISRNLELVSAYFIPDDRGTEFLEKVRKRGASVSVLTNAFQTTDVAMVHAGYSKYRNTLLESGVTIFELKPGDSVVSGENELSVTGSSGASLHAKTLGVDDKRVFIGSFNFDPRSVFLNCEMGFLIESPSLAREVSAAFGKEVAEGAYRVELSDGSMHWIETAADGREIIHTSEPGMTFFEKAIIRVLGWLPIQWLL